jgi:hypothetical protein
MKKALIAVLVPLVSAACGGGSDAETDAMPETAPAAATAAAPSVTISMPADGSTVTGPAVMVHLETTVPLLPAGDMTAGSGHHHLYLDADLTPADQPVPTVPGSIVHMGDASVMFTFENVPPGEHRLIAVVADGVHVPLLPWVVDTITFTVR